eukprot:1153275-Pelagomonas_calceolata.AAC.3
MKGLCQAAAIRQVDSTAVTATARFGTCAEMCHKKEGKTMWATLQTFKALQCCYWTELHASSPSMELFWKPLYNPNVTKFHDAFKDVSALTGCIQRSPRRHVFAFAGGHPCFPSYQGAYVQALSLYACKVPNCVFKPFAQKRCAEHLTLQNPTPRPYYLCCNICVRSQGSLSSGDEEEDESSASEEVEEEEEEEEEDAGVSGAVTHIL